jgi:hypothetical protein
LYCDASSAQFCTHYYYLKLAFWQTLFVLSIGLNEKEILLFISFGSLGLRKEENSYEFAEQPEIQSFSAVTVIEVPI